MPFKIIRVYEDRSIPSETIKTVQTEEEAQFHCKDPETSSRTCKEPRNIQHTRINGRWFDCYREE